MRLFLAAVLLVAGCAGAGTPDRLKVEADAPAHFSVRIVRAEGREYLCIVYDHKRGAGLWCERRSR